MLHRSPGRWKWAFSIGLAVATAVGSAQTIQLQIERASGPDLSLSWPNDGTSFQLQKADLFKPPLAWSAANEAPTLRNQRWMIPIRPTGAQQYFRLIRAPTAVLTTVSSSSPAPGETGVSPLRETILRWSKPLAPDVVLNDKVFFATADGRKFLTRAEISKDRRSTTLFFLEPLPRATRVTVTWNVEGAKDSTGTLLDPDGDGVPGGARVVIFTTANTVAIPGTAVTGHVYASEPVRTAGSTNNLPLAGVIVTVDGQEQNMRATTDAEGRFVLSPCPAGEFFVHIDGRFAEGSEWPGGAYYPYVGKTFIGLPGRTNSVPGGTGEIFLPRVAAETLKSVSVTQPTPVTIPASVAGTNTSLAAVRITVQANALFADDGTRGGMVGIAPVPSDRLPSPLPAGLVPPLVITIQTDGPSNFDQPVPVRFPNLPDPSTGRVLPPGAKSMLWSFNHDTGRWEPQGPMTVSADGLYVESDAGTGVLQPGWHAFTAGTPGNGGGGAGGSGGPCGPEQQALNNALTACALNLGTGVFLDMLNAGGFGCVLSLANAAVSTAVACQTPQTSCAGSMLYYGFFGAAGCAPPPYGTCAAVAQCIWEVGNAMGALLFCQLQNQPVPSPAASLASFRPGVHTAALAPEEDSPLHQSLAASEDLRRLLISILGDERWLETAVQDRAGSVAFMNGLVAALEPGSDAGAQVSAAERNALLPLTPAGASNEQVTALIDRFDRFAAGGMTEAERSATDAAAGKVQSTVGKLSAQGWSSIADGLIQTLREATAKNDQEIGSSLDQPRLRYRLDDLVTGALRYGEIPRGGGISNLILNENTEYQLHLLDPATLEIGTASFRSAGPGALTRIPRIWLMRAVGSDQDQDGLIDTAEAVLGTDPGKADTDRDGTSDLVEARQGTDPLDGLGWPAGVVANTPISQRPGRLSSSAIGLDVKDPLAVVAIGYGGLAVFDVTDTLRPVRLLEFGMDGYSTAVAYSPDSKRAAVSIGVTEDGSYQTQINWIDLADLSAPQLVATNRFDGYILHERDGLIYAGSSQAFRVKVYDARTAEERGEVSDLNGRVTGILKTHDRLFITTSASLSVFDNALPTPKRLGSLAGNFSASNPSARTRMVLDGTILFVAKVGGGVAVDVSDSAAPRLVGTPASAALSWRDVGLNGAGLAVALRAFQALNDSPNLGALIQLFDVSDPTDMRQGLATLQALAVPSELFLLEGRALLTDGLAGLTVINPVGPEVISQAPTLQFDPLTIDLDPAKPGIQATAGTRISLRPAFHDNVQFGHADLLLNGMVAASTRSYPIEWVLTVPPSCPANCPEQRLEMIAFDGAGNSARLGPWTLDPVPPVGN